MSVVNPIGIVVRIAVDTGNRLFNPKLRSWNPDGRCPAPCGRRGRRVDTLTGVKARAGGVAGEVAGSEALCGAGLIVEERAVAGFTGVEGAVAAGGGRGGD